MILADLTIGGRARKVIMQAPKNGFFYVLDRITGEFISGDAFATVTWAKGLDEKGRPIETEEARYRFTPVRLSPSPIGAHHWPPMAFNPQTGLVYFPGQETSSLFRMTEEFEFKVGQWNTGIRMGGAASVAKPAPPTGAAPAGGAGSAAKPAGGGATATPVNIPRGGFIVAWDPIARKPRWCVPVNPSGGMLSTAGNLVFGSDQSGRFMALNAATGQVLWETKLLSGLATPITYELDGKQYVAVMSGQQKGRVFSFVIDGKAPMPAP
jgi:quinohemoprotein ethanol dehydrogenase